MKDNSTRAKVRVTIEMEDLGNWSKETTLDQIQRQAKEAAYSRLSRALSGQATLVRDSFACQIIVTDEGHENG